VASLKKRGVSAKVIAAALAEIDQGEGA